MQDISTDQQKGGKGNMAVTRRQFVAGLGALAATMGFNPAQIAKITEAVAYGPPFTGKPKVLWVHGAECTGCSVSLLSLFEDVNGEALMGTGTTTLDALGLVTDPNDVPRTLHEAGFNVDGNGAVVNIADVLVDFLDLQYHETVMGMGGDLAYKFLREQMDNAQDGEPFVLVVEGATQDTTLKGAWNDDSTHPWCSVGMSDNGVDELAFDDVVGLLAGKPNCAAVLSIGQCASFGGYPAAVPPAFKGLGDNGGRQTGAKSTYDYLVSKGMPTAAGKVVNVPGCPPNPWWFVLTVVAWLVDFNQTARTAGAVGPLGILEATGTGPLDVTFAAGAVDKTRRLNAVYGIPLHGPACPRYAAYVKGEFASKPGDAGCLQLIGCKAPSTNSLCGTHGWNNQQPENRGAIDTYNVADLNGIRGGNCIMGGHPCMACTEKGYPDSFVPFVLR